MSEPLVTCICPTMPSRSEWLRKAIECFKAQDYPNKQMVIVIDTDPGRASENFMLQDDPMIAVMVANVRTLGEKRNLACDVSSADFIAHFDDDDWSAPARLTDQVNRLHESGLAVTGYRILKFTDGKRWWRYELPATRVYGTTLCYRRDWWKENPFIADTPSADNMFCARAFAGKQLIGVDARDLMYATNHTGNSSKRVTPHPSMETEAIVLPCSVGSRRLAPEN